MIPAPIAGNIYNSGNLQAGLSWSPDFFGKHAADLQAALGQARAAKADSAAAANQLAAQVARSYIALARLIAQKEVAQRTLGQRQSLLNLSEQRTRAGLDSQVELTQAQAGMPDAQTQIEMLGEQITLARRTIAVLCAQAPDAQNALSPRLSVLRIQPVPQALGADLLGRRPDVVAARWRVEAATQGIESARADFYPDVNLTAFVGLNALGLDNLLQGSSRQMGITPALRLPIFDGKRLRAQLRGKQADLDTAIAPSPSTTAPCSMPSSRRATRLPPCNRCSASSSCKPSRCPRPSGPMTLPCSAIRPAWAVRSPCSTPKPSSSTSVAWPWTCRHASSIPAWPWPQPWAVAGATTPRLLHCNRHRTQQNQ